MHSFRLPVLALLCAAIAAHAQTPTITLTSTVKQAKVIPAGINVDDAAYLLRDNLLFDNQGFEQPTGAVYINCRTLTANVCVTDNPYAAWPAGYANNWTFRPQIVGAGTTGQVVSQSAANNGQGLVLTLSVAPGTSHIILEGTMPSNKVSDISNWLGNGNGSVTTEQWDAGDGAQSVLVDGTNGWEQLYRYFDNVQNGYSMTQLNGNYTINFMAKPESATNVTITIRRLTAGGIETFLQKTVALTAGWASYSIPFTAAETGAQLGNAQVIFEVDGGSILMDDISMPKVESGNTSPFRTQLITAMKSLHPGTLRFMNGAGFAVKIDDAISPINLRRPALSATTKLQAQSPSVDYFQAMQLAQTLGARPWITIPQTITPAEMQNLIQWLAGSSSTTYGAKRAARGQTQPWTSVFPVIYLELGNEDWNASMDDNNTGDPVTYGKHANDIFTAAHASANWTSGITLVANGWATNAPDGATALYWESNVRQQITVPFMMSEAPYLYGTYNDGSSLEAIYGPLFGEVQQFDDPVSGLTTRLYQDLAANGDDMGVYEENIGTDNGYANQSQLDQMTATIGSGIAVGDHMLQMMGIGVKAQNLFTLTGILNVTNIGLRTNLWGAVIDIGGASNLKRPTWLVEQMINAAVMPTMLTTTQANMPTYSAPVSQNDSLPAVNNVQDIRSYAFTDGLNTSLVVINMNRTAATTVALSGFPLIAPASITQLASANITDGNENSQVVNPVALPTTRWNAGAVTLPAFSMTTYTWNVVSGTTITNLLP